MSRYWLASVFLIAAAADVEQETRWSACSAHTKCSELSGDCCPTPGGNMLDCCTSSEATSAALPPQPETATPVSPPTPTGGVSGSTGKPLAAACQSYLQAKGLNSAEALAAKLNSCQPGPSHQTYAPRPEPDIPGATDTTNLQCQYNSVFGHNPMCCGWRPHFNWVVGTCERNPRIPNASFCDGVPACAREPKINYAAAYQYNGSHFILQDASTAGDVSSSGVSGSFKDKTGWEAVKEKFRWEGGEGDWPTKYAPWGLGADGPRGLTPPAGLWLLSVDSMYYGTLYMLSQLTLNAQGNKEHNNCWEWEFDAIEGLLGTVPKGSPLPGNLNQLYVTATAQVTGCMPIPGTAAQGNGRKPKFSEPRSFEKFCAQHPDAIGCKPWTAEGADIWHGGGHQGTDRFENFEDTPYVFAVVIDQQGFWVYRWRPDDAGGTGWPGVSQFGADRVLAKHPRKITKEGGLKTDVKGNVDEAVILVPSLLPEAACTRSAPEQVDFRWGAAALGSMAYELDAYQAGQQFSGAQNWWAHYADTKQLQDYPLSIAGIPASEAARDLQYSCRERGTFGSTCSCRHPESRRMQATQASQTSQKSQAFLSYGEKAWPSSEVAMMLQNMFR